MRVNLPTLPSNQKQSIMIHSFKTALAKMYGIEEAVMIHNFHHWITENKANDRNFFDGRYWTFNSQKAYAELFPYLNEGKIKRVIGSLIEKGILMKGNYNTNQYDRTNWYAFTDEGLAIVQNYYIDWSKTANGRVENDRPIPNNKPNSKQYIFIPSDEGALFDPEDTASITMPTPAEHTNSKGARNKNVTSEQVEEWFEDLWLMYERKGSKANAKKEFAKLTEDEVELMRLHIPAYIQSRPERQYRQDFERYIKHKTFNSVVYSKTNDMLYDPEARNTSATQETPAEFRKEDETFTMNGITYR